MHRGILVTVGAVVVVATFAVVSFILNRVLPPSLDQGRPALVAVPPLPPLTRTSTVLAPAAIAIPAIRQALEAQAPRNLAGKRQNPVSRLLSNADIHWTVARGALAVAGRPDALIVSAPLTGEFQATGQITGEIGALGGAIGSIIGGNVGQQVQGLVNNAFDQHADVRGNVTVTSRPTIAPNWRVAPNLAAQVNIADVVMPIAGIKISVANEVKPFLDNAVREQTAALEARVRNDPGIEKAARQEWGRLCRSIALGAAGPGMPDLWLEVRPTKAIAAQPKIDASAVTLLLGVQAETRIVPTETKPDCPFPAQLEIVPQANEGVISVGVPIDMPFVEVSKLLETQLQGRKFPEDGGGSYQTTIEHAGVAASGDRLLISLGVKVRRKGFFSFGDDANVHVYGRPVLDQEHQILRFTDITLDVQSATAFGLLSAAAQAAVPYLQKTLAERAVIDLKPLADNAKKRMAAAVTDIARQGPAIHAKIGIDDLRLVGIAFDANTLRIIADANGTVNVAVDSLALQ